MAEKGEEPVGSMGIDTPLACLSDKPQPLFHYFKQLFAQVTNPPIDPIREELVMSLTSYLGTERNLLDETPQHCHTLKLAHPILTNYDLEKLRRLSWGDFLATTLPMLYGVDGGPKELERSLDRTLQARLARHQERLHRPHPLRPRRRRGFRAHPLAARAQRRPPSPRPRRHPHPGRPRPRNRRAARDDALLPAHRLRRQRRQPLPGLRDSGKPRRAQASSPTGVTFDTAHKNYKKAINKGILKVISKMGISTLQSYRGAQIFEAIGLSHSLIDKYFTGTPSRIDGVDLEVLAEEASPQTRLRLPPFVESETELDVGGAVPLARRRRIPLVNPRQSRKLQHAVRQNSFANYKEYADHVNDQSRQLCTLRGLLEFQLVGQASAHRGGRARHRDRQALRHRRHVASARSPRKPTRPSPSP